MSLPTPKPGLVIRYSYLWADDAAKGHEEGEKDRPAAIIVAIDGPKAGQPRVLVLPITHSAPVKGVEAIEIPDAVARRAGLDAARSWVVLSEFNDFIWPGFDLRTIPNSNPPTIAYGFLTPGFFASLRDRWLKLDEERKSKSVPRS